MLLLDFSLSAGLAYAKMVGTPYADDFVMGIQSAAHAVRSPRGETKCVHTLQDDKTRLIELGRLPSLDRRRHCRKRDRKALVVLRPHKLL
jgi:hypothetical protein